MTRRRLVLRASLLGVGLTLTAAAACTFPSVTYNIINEAPSDEGGAELDSGQTPGPALDAGTDAPDDSGLVVNPDASDGAVVLSDAAVTPIDASACVTCDCDNDGYNRLDLATGCDGGGGSKGNQTDCEDRIQAINPGVSSFVLNTWPATSWPYVGDWNCDRTTVVDHAINGQCGVLCSPGFAGNGPPCGGSAEFLVCKGGLLGALCSKDTNASASATQGCF